MRGVEQRDLVSEGQRVGTQVDFKQEGPDEVEELNGGRGPIERLHYWKG